MRIMALKPGHDGSVALVEDGRLIYSLEAEKDSFSRYGAIHPSLLLQAASMSDGFPDLIAIGGWHKFVEDGRDTGVGAGYHGAGAAMKDMELFGHKVPVFSSTHERSHIFMAIGMAPMVYRAQRCGVLVWEGRTGSLYEWDPEKGVAEKGRVLNQPGAKWGALYALTDPAFPDAGAPPGFDYAGKLMALAGIPASPVDPLARRTVDSILRQDSVLPFNKAMYRNSPLYNCGPNSEPVHAAAAYMADAIYRRFRDAARAALPKDMPLLISGGCGLNCDWNQRFGAEDFLSGIFVPPCTNDSGSAIGTAIDAQFQMTGEIGLDWSVYSGAEFELDASPDPNDWEARALDLPWLASRIHEGAVVSWVQGRAEIGPRALGHRSLLASATRRESHDRLNEIKAREAYRPIAPVCIREDVPRWFDGPVVDPYMLFTSRVRSGGLPAVTHADGTARVQALAYEDCPNLWHLLNHTYLRSGYSVLCNTSLNYNGRGFINRMSDLEAYSASRRLDAMVVDEVMWVAR